MTTMPFSRLKLKSKDFENPRTSSGLERPSIIELGLNILHAGLVNALVVTSDGLIVAGQRRYRAIEWLIDALNTNDPRLVSAHELTALGGRLTTVRSANLSARINGFIAGVPVSIVELDGIALEGIALADNLQRVDLSSYEITTRLVQLNRQGVNGRQLARLIGKSPTYVSQKLTAWARASSALKEAWKRGELTDDAVRQIAELPADQQAAQLTDPPKAVRGPANRPSIDDVRDALLALEQRLEGAAALERITHEDVVPVEERRYAQGVLDVLRWVTGQPAPASLGEIIRDVT